MLPEDEASAVLDAYHEAHPKLWSILDDAMTELSGRHDYDLPLVRLALQPHEA